MEKYVPLIVAGIFALFIIVGVLWGLIRGLKRTAFRAGWIVVIAVICFFVAPLITKSVMNMSIFNINVGDGVTCKTLTELATYYLGQIEDYGKFLTAPDTIDIMITLVGLVVNAFVFAILFWAVKIVLYPIWAIVTHFVIRKKDREGNKLPRHRAWGMLVGGFLGLFVATATMMPVMGVVNMVSSIEKSTTDTYTKKVENDDGTITEVELTGGEFSRLGLEDIMKYINAYDKSATSKILTYTGVQPLMNVTFNGISTGKMDGEKVVLKDEVKTVVCTMGSIDTLRNIGFDNLTQSKVRRIINASKTLVNQVFNNKTISALGNKLMPQIIDEILNNPDFIIQLPNTGSDSLDDALKEGTTEIKDITFSTIRNELLCILNVAEILNEKDFICKVANKEVTGANKILGLLDETTVNSITDELFKMQTISSLSPIIINASLNLVAEKLDVKDFAINKDGATTDEVKNLFKTMFMSVVDINNSLDMDSKYYVTSTTLPLVGKLLDSIKNYGGLDETNYKLLINALEDKAITTIKKDLTSTDTSLDGMKNVIIDSLHNISEVSSFETEFTKINAVYQDIIDMLNEMSGEEVTLNLSKLGNVLDTFKTTTIFGSSVNSLVKEALSYFNSKVTTDFAQLSTIIERVKLNVDNVTSWKTELGMMDDFVNVATDIMDAEDLKTALLTDGSTMLVDFGNALNKLKNSVLFGSEIKNIVNTVIDQVEDLSIENADMLTDSFTVIKRNINEAEDIDWGKEFGTMKTLLNSLMDLADSTTTSEQLVTIGKTFDTIITSNSKIITREVINTILKTTITQFAGEVESGSDLEDIMNTLKTKIDATQLTFEQEIKALNSLFNHITDVDTTSLDFENFGRILDSYDENTGSEKSVLVSSIRPKIVVMIINKIDKSSMDEKMVTIVNKIKDNAVNIVSYQNEFKSLKSLTDMVDGITTVNVDTFNFGDFGNKLDGFNDSVLVKPIRKDILDFIVDKVTITNEQEEIAIAINEILANTKVCGTKAENGELTYKQIFTDLGKVKYITTSLTTVEVSRSNKDAIKNMGEKLDELDALCIVPKTASVRIAKYITGEIVGENGIKSIMPAGYESKPELVAIYNAAVDKVSPIDTKYDNYLNDPTSVTLDTFANDFTSIYNTIVEVDEKLTTAGM
ncbi:MAG TPA: hypothetical protein DD621_02540 [Clostridiales bacterium]|nr:hypothetical protein [Clostridiales bacterium]